MHHYLLCEVSLAWLGVLRLCRIWRHYVVFCETRKSSSRTCFRAHWFINRVILPHFGKTWLFLLNEILSLCIISSSSTHDIEGWFIFLLRHNLFFNRNSTTVGHLNIIMLLLQTRCSSYFNLAIFGPGYLLALSLHLRTISGVFGLLLIMMSLHYLV